MRPVRNWLHRKGIARVVNSSSNNMTPDGRALIEARGPRPVARWFARYALRRTGYIHPDWLTVRIIRTRCRGWWHYDFEFAYRRIR